MPIDERDPVDSTQTIPPDQRGPLLGPATAHIAESHDGIGGRDDSFLAVRSPLGGHRFVPSLGPIRLRKSEDMTMTLPSQMAALFAREQDQGPDRMIVEERSRPEPGIGDVKVTYDRYGRLFPDYDDKATRHLEDLWDEASPRTNVVPLRSRDDTT